MSRPGLTYERLVAVFLLGVLLFTPPFIGIFNNPQLIFGIPNLYLYLFTAWMLLILLMAVVIESSDANETPVGAPDSQTGSIDTANEKPGP
jgi:hypothetical protein